MLLLSGSKCFYLFIILFFQREGPPPGQYKLSKDSILPKGPNVTSPFKSKTPRFVQPHVLVMSSIINIFSQYVTKIDYNFPWAKCLKLKGTNAHGFTANIVVLNISTVCKSIH